MERDGHADRGDEKLDSVGVKVSLHRGQARPGGERAAGLQCGPVERRGIYLDERTVRAAEVIIEAGHADNVSAAIRIAVRQFAAIVAPSLVTPSTPAA